MNKLFELGLVPVDLVKKTVTIADQTTGEEHKGTVFVKPLSFASATADLKGIGDSEEESIARRIAHSICDENGKPIFTAAQINGEDGKALSTQLTYELLRVIGEVNNLGKTEA